MVLKDFLKPPESQRKNENLEKDENIFEIELIHNCIGEEVYIYHLPRPLTKDFEDSIKCFGNLKYPLGKGFSFIKLETNDFILIGNLGSTQLKLMIKSNSAIKVKDEFEKQLGNYLRR